LAANNFTLHRRLHRDPLCAERRAQEETAVLILRYVLGMQHEQNSGSRMTQRVVLFLAIISLCFSSARGNDRRFSYTYETSVLPPGVREIEVWNTYRTGRNSLYRALDQSVEYEVGVAPGVMTALYLNVSSQAIDSNGDSPGGSMLTSQSFSVSNEWKFKFSDRAADLVGAGLYAEATVGVNRVELEGKLLFDKQLGATLIALNLVGEYELNAQLIDGISGTLTETTFAPSLGISQQIMKRFGIGIEALNQNNLTGGVWNSSTLFAGGVISYTADTWWSTITVLPQIRELRAVTPTGLELTDHEKVQARLLLSFHL
jgi:hypothetical protein